MDPVKAYELLQNRQVNEDRILAERTRTFLLATSFLFAAFVVLLTSDSTDCIFKVLGIILSSVGIILTFLLFFFNQNASIALEFWHKAQRKIEQISPEFDYMRSKEITPHVDEGEVMKGKKGWVEVIPGHWVLMPVTKRWWQRRLLINQIIYMWFIPGSFLALWIAALAVSIVRIFS